MRNWFQMLSNRRHPTHVSALDPLGSEPPPMPSERSTGLVFAAAAVVIAAIFRSVDVVLTAALLAAAVFAIIAIAVPRWLAPLNRAWFALALLLNRIVSPVVMFILFAGLIVPAGLVMQLRRDPLRATRRRDAVSYWIDRDPGSATVSMRDQF